MPIQPRAAILRLNSGFEPDQLRTRRATGTSAIASARKARTSARSASHSGGSAPGLIRRPCIAKGSRALGRDGHSRWDSLAVLACRREGSSMRAEPSSAGSSGPLAGVRVLDLTAVVAGPLATQILGDYGADVIKVEAPEGDRMRANGVTRRPRGLSSIFLAINRNKRSLCVDLKTSDGVAVIKRLLPTVDVLVHNMRPAAMERLGLGYETASTLNPRLVYCAAPGFGQDGPDAAKPAFDDVIQAACGLA